MRVERPRVVLAAALALVAAATATAGDGLRKTPRGDGSDAKENGVGLWGREYGSAAVSASPFLRQKRQEDNRLLSEVDWPALNRIGSNPAGLLQACEGDCDSYKTCEVGLECVQRSSGSSADIAGCSGDMTEFPGDDYCRIPFDGVLAEVSSGDRPELGLLGHCRGQCDSDQDCQALMLCFERAGYEPVPGCAGPGKSGASYCYDPNMPTTDSTYLPALNYISGNPYGLLLPCEGDCDGYKTCDIGLECVQRATGSSADIVGCSGDMAEHPGDDYCRIPIDGVLAEVLNGDRPELGPLGHCKGHCDSDQECQTGMLCFKRDRFEPVPGCDGHGTIGMDYCYDPTVDDSTTTNDLPALNYIADSPDTTVVGLLQPCEGSCRSYKTCDIGLECFRRGTGSSADIAGCSGDMMAVPGADYCRVPIDGVLAEVSNGDRSELGLLGHCRGECDSYKDCQDGLECFFRDLDKTEVVVGCEGDHSQLSNSDFCRIPVPGYVSFVTNNGDRIDKGSMSECQGDCDSDSDCQGDLLCFQRGGYDFVPGCDGPGRSGTDYCYNASPTTDTPTISPSHSLTSSPITNSPTTSPSSSPTKYPVASPTYAPASDSPTISDPTAGLTNEPSDSPTSSPIVTSNSPTASPTDSPRTHDPTSSPTGGPSGDPVTNGPTAPPSDTMTGRPTNDWPALNYIDSNPDTTNGLLQACEGDCNSYKTCDIGLECFQRDTGSPADIFGCNGDMTEVPGADYCRVPIEGVLAEVSNGDRSELGLLGHCRGECDSYKDCQEGLECFFRDENPTEVVVGCEGDHTKNSGADYCRVPVLGYVSYLTNNGDRISEGCLDECQGDCDADEDCQTHLLCFSRDGYDPVPGCDGLGTNGVGYCYDPTRANPTSTIPIEPLNPTISSVPTPGPTITRAPTNAGDAPRSGSSRVLFTSGDESVELAKSSPGSLVTLNKLIISSGADGTSTPDVLVPLARSYDGHDWESSAGDFAISAPDVHGCHNVFAEGSCMIPLPALTDLASESYVLSTYEYQLSRKDSIARVLEKITFGVTTANLIDFEASFGGNGAIDVETAFAEYVKDQMDNVETTSHREFYRRRTNPRWAYSLSPARSDHPCSPNSQWRRYAFSRMDRYDEDASRYLQVSFPTAATEVLGSTLYEAEAATIIDGPTIGTRFSGYTGTGYLDYLYTIGDFIEWEVNAPSAGNYQLSFYFANAGGRSLPLDINVNGVLISAMSFPYMKGWSSWTYTDFLTVTLNAGTNTIRTVQTTGHGPNIDHLRIGKDRPSAVLAIDGHARTVVPELWLAGNRAYTFQSTFFYEICNWSSFVPTYQYSRGVVHVLLENGECEALSVGNPAVAFPAGFEEFAPSEHRLDLPDPSGGRLIPIETYLMPDQTYNHLDEISTDQCDQFPATSELGDAPIFGELPDGTLMLWDPKLKLEDNTEASPLTDGGGGVHKTTGEHVLCMNAPQTFLNEDTCQISQDGSDSCTATNGGTTGGGVLVCGSVGEVKNDPLQGSNFDFADPEISTTSDERARLHQQRATVWTKVALTAPDQLRQRIAWALSQVLVIVADGIAADPLTEPFLAYYDIFTRNAFGNYRDILSEIVYSPLMGEHLSYISSKSAAYMWDASTRIAFADENFAREVMQLFTIGLYKLNPDGTQVLDSASGEPIQAYSNADIVSFAKAWTGFTRQSPRGNIEDGPKWSQNRLDPMAIHSAWRDMFPKSDLTGGYIGDKYPLCVDLPDKMFLSKGAKYRLLGKNPLPKLMEDNPNFADDDLMSLYNGLRMVLSDGLDNDLYDVLNNDGNYAPTVTLDANLNCVGNECLVDTVRVVKVNDVYFEYVRPPCVELSFFEGGKAINLDKAVNSGRMCANPFLPYASEACLDASDPIMQPATRNYIYLGERMTYALAEARCAAEGKELGTFYSARYNDQEWQTGYHWQDNTCDIYAVVNGAGYVAITHNPFDYTLNGAKHLDEQNLNFFKVFWEGGNYPTVENNCASSACKVLSEGCLCQTEVIESQVFGSDPMDANDILSQLSIGAMDPSSFVEGTFESPESIADFTVHKRNSGSAYDKGTVFEATDSKGRSYFLKNVKSSVRLKGWAYDPTIHEAEDAVFEGATLGISSYVTGTGFVDPKEYTSAFISWTVPISQAGDYTIYFRYSLGSSSSSSGPDRPLEIMVNNVVVNPSLSFKNTGSYDNLRHTAPLTVTLNAGTNVIRAKATGNKGADIDHMRIEGVDASLDTGYVFRNAPHFMSMIRDADPYGIGEATVRDAQYETDAVLDYYFYHDNTAPFLCIRFIQRFGISNPSPRYVAECAQAFQSGSYATSSGHAFGTGSYGDLSAAFAAVLLDRESSAGVLDKDPASGALREPLLKIISLMKAMEFSADENPILWSMENGIGQQAHEFETVFSFFLPEYKSGVGPTSSASLVAPEAQLVDMPKTIDLLNGMFSMIKYGLSDCSGGFGVWGGKGSCSRDGDYSRASGILNYQPAPESTVYQIVEELATLLTAGRLSEERRQYLRDTYNSFADKTKALSIVQQLITVSPEFQSTNAVESDGSGIRLPPAPKPAASNDSYKAIVYLFLSGGCDSFNMLTPHTCATVGGEPDVHAQYMDVRGEVALDKATTLEIPAGSNTKFPQPCSSFGLHPMLTTLRDLYEAGDALFVANSGVMAKPVTVEDYLYETPVLLFAHNTMQRETVTVDIFDEISGTGVIGRLTDKLSRDGFRTGSFSVSGNTIALKGQPGVSSATATISRRSGVTEFNPDPTAGSCRDMKEMIKEMNNATEVDSGFFSETWSIALNQALDQNEELRACLEVSSINTAFPDTYLGQNLETVAKLIQTHEMRGNNREVFYISTGGYDTHSDVTEELDLTFAVLNGGIDAFVKELRDEQNIWNDVVFAQYSEFARTLVPNSGAGTDHAWGGNHFILGGALNGGHVLGKYPSDLRRGNGVVMDDSRGRLVPSTPFDADWNSLAQWFGVAEADLAEVMPNKINFDSDSSLFDLADLFGA